MRKIIIALISLFNTSFAQLPIDSGTHLITYSGIVNASGNQDELYSRAREWFAKTYNSSMKVIQMDSKDKIVGKALMQVYQKSFGLNTESGYINYTISIYIKDGRYKYEINNFYHTGEYVGGSWPDIPDYGACEEMMHEKRKHTQKVFNYYLTQMDENTKVLIAGLKEIMNKQSVNKDF